MIFSDKFSIKLLQSAVKSLTIVIVERPFGRAMWKRKNGAARLLWFFLFFIVLAFSVSCQQGRTRPCVTPALNAVVYSHKVIEYST